MARIDGRTDRAPEPAGPYSQSVRIGNIVAAAGQGGAEPATGKISSHIGDQTRQALANVAAVLEASGASLDDVIRVGVFLTDVDDFAAMNSVYETIFAAPYPARTTVYVGLPGHMKVEIDAIAALES